MEFSVNGIERAFSFYYQGLFYPFTFLWKRCRLSWLFKPLILMMMMMKYFLIYKNLVSRTASRCPHLNAQDALRIACCSSIIRPIGKFTSSM